MNLRNQIVEFEGWKHEAYPDPLTGGEPITIGCGATGPDIFLGLMWSDEKISQRLSDDIAKCLFDLQAALPWFAHISAERQAVLANMRFQMGLKGLMQFRKMLAAMRDDRWADAANEMRHSKWYTQTRKRAERLARQCETSEWN